MTNSQFIKRIVACAVAATAPLAPADAAGGPGEPVLAPSAWPKLGTVDRHYLSFNIEMAEVTGGEFWAPYDDPQRRRLAPRPPLDLDDPRLLTLIKGISPTTIRVSGTWANSTYIPAGSEATPSGPPPGFKQVLRPERWQALTSLAKASGSSLLLSFPASPGARTPDGQWSEEQARRLVALTRAHQIPIRAVEFINEPNLATLGSLPAGYRAVDYARDFRRFREFARQEIPEVLVLGHSLSGRGGEIPSADIARETAGLSDAVSYHFYGALSERCAEYGNQTSPSAALGEAWLARTAEDRAWFAALRDRYDPGKPIWLTETAQAACGGDRWASSYRDSFRFVDQLGRLAQSGIQVVAHNTLASGDYALVDRTDFRPRPNYWMAWMWRRTMGSTVLQPNGSEPGLKVYAHCHAQKPGGVAAVILVLADSARRVRLPRGSRVSILTADTLDARKVRINGRRVEAGLLERREVPSRRTASGRLLLPPRSIAFVQSLGARNPACDQGL